MTLLVARKDVDICTGHDACPPRKAVEGSPDVFLEGYAVVRQGDLWESHGCPAHPPHQGRVLQASDEVIVNGLPVVRVGDPLDCGGNVQTGCEALYAGGKLSSANPNAILSRMDPGEMPRAAEEAPLDAARAQELVPLAKELGEQYGIPPALALGIASRESGFGRHLDENGYGKYDSNGYGMFQVDKQYHTPTGDPYSRAHAEQAMGIFRNDLDRVAAAHPDWPREQQLATATAAYNFGYGNARTQPADAAGWARLDDGTSGDDYSRDVWARAQYFADNLEW